MTPTEAFTESILKLGLVGSKAVSFRKGMINSMKILMYLRDSTIKSNMATEDGI